MFSVIYSFQIKEGQSEVFERAWAGMTELIKQYEGGLGSRLHKKGDLDYIAYAQWPDKETWQNAGGNMPETSQELRAAMRASCEKIETLFELDVVNDLLVHLPE